MKRNIHLNKMFLLTSILIIVGILVYDCTVLENFVGRTTRAILNGEEMPEITGRSNPKLDIQITSIKPLLNNKNKNRNVCS